MTALGPVHVVQWRPRLRPNPQAQRQASLAHPSLLIASALNRGKPTLQARDRTPFSQTDQVVEIRIRATRGRPREPLRLPQLKVAPGRPDTVTRAKQRRGDRGGNPRLGLRVSAPPRETDRNPHVRKTKPSAPRRGRHDRVTRVTLKTCGPASRRGANPIGSGRNLQPAPRIRAAPRARIVASFALTPSDLPPVRLAQGWLWDALLAKTADPACNRRLHPPAREGTSQGTRETGIRNLLSRSAPSCGRRRRCSGSRPADRRRGLLSRSGGGRGRQRDCRRSAGGGSCSS